VPCGIRRIAKFTRVLQKNNLYPVKSSKLAI
jgi:hypothetical protein